MICCSIYIMMDQREQLVMTGYLEIIMGPMFSGKTSKLLDIYKQCQYCDIPVCVINHQSDTRYSESMLSTHDKVMIPCIQTTMLGDLAELHKQGNDSFHNSAVVLINEAQFFEDLYTSVVDMLKQNKRVYVCGLDGDFKRERFGQLLDLIPLCDKVTKLHSLCGICKNGQPGLFSKRITGETDQRVVGSDNYVPVCRGCYEKN